MDILARVRAPKADDSGSQCVLPTHGAKKRVTGDNSEWSVDMVLDDELAQTRAASSCSPDSSVSGASSATTPPVGPALLSSTHWPAKAPGLTKSGEHSVGERGEPSAICTGAVVPATTTGTGCGKSPSTRRIDECRLRPRGPAGPPASR